MVVTQGETRVIADPFDQPGEIVSVLLHAAMYIRLRLGEFLERYELTEGRHAVLMSLDRAGSRGLSQAEVADQLMQSESNISSLINHLQKDGLVDRRWSDTDRRKRILHLTAPGQELLDRVETARHRWAESLLSAIPSETRTGFALGLNQLPGRSERLPTAPIADSKPAVVAVTVTQESVAEWPNPKSPHFALERMLSTLRLANGYTEDEQ